MISLVGHFQTQFKKFSHVTLGEMKKQADKCAWGMFFGMTEEQLAQNEQIFSGRQLGAKPCLQETIVGFLDF